MNVEIRSLRLVMYSTPNCKPVIIIVISIDDIKKLSCCITDGYGDWRTDGCDIEHRTSSLVTVYCYHLTAFAILEVSKRAHIYGVNSGKCF